MIGTVPLTGGRSLWSAKLSTNWRWNSSLTFPTLSAWTTSQPWVTVRPFSSFMSSCGVGPLDWAIAAGEGRSRAATDAAGRRRTNRSGIIGIVLQVDVAEEVDD